jgi:hypothetical protein
MHTLRSTTLKTALALGLGLTALGGWTAVQAQDAPVAPLANGPGPATQPPPPPGTTAPAPTQPAAPPTPPGTTAGTAPAAPPATPPPNYGIQYNGLIDGYYLFNFNNPKDVSAGGGHYYDVRHNSPALSLAELNVFQNAKPQGIGFKATLITGDTADLNHYDFQGASRGLGEARYKNVQQLYGTYSFSADGAGVDFGKFYTPFGYEVVEANGNYNYSRSLPFAIVPTYHAGARIYTPVPGLAALTATLYVVNGIFNTPTLGVANDSKRPGFIGQLNYTDPKGKFTLISELGLGKQKFGGTVDIPGPDTKVTLNDNNFTYNFNANMLAGLDYVYSELKPSTGGKATTNGYAVYYRQALTPKTAYALRFSGYDAKNDDGMGGINHFRPSEITGTYEIKPAANFTTRFEYRHDTSNTPFFLDKDSNPTKKNQDTVEIGGIFTF